MVKENLEVGSIVFVYEQWSGCVIKAEIIDVHENYYELHMLYHVNKEGEEFDRAYGTTNRAIKDVWISAKDAFDAIDSKRKESIDNYKAEIKTVEDLVAFPLNHCFCGEEYTDYEAMAAYKIRCMELLNIGVE